MDRTFFFELLSLQVPLNPAYQVKEVEFTLLKVQSVGPTGTIACIEIETEQKFLACLQFLCCTSIGYW